MSTIIPLGKLAADDAGRDAIHIAVAPIVAADIFSPGEHVGVNSDGKASRNEPHIGIVDPYLKKTVKPGERFYLCLYPNTITSLRHHWVHPALKEEAPPSKADFDKSESEAWLREYAKRVNPHYAEGGYYYKQNGGVDESYRILMEDLAGNTITYHGIDMHERGGLIDEEGLQRHASIVLGRQINFDGFAYFSCSC